MPVVPSLLGPFLNSTAQLESSSSDIDLIRDQIQGVPQSPPVQSVLPHHLQNSQALTTQKKGCVCLGERGGNAGSPNYLCYSFAHSWELSVAETIPKCPVSYVLTPGGQVPFGLGLQAVKATIDAWAVRSICLNHM